jgi:transposase InsO family protein
MEQRYDAVMEVLRDGRSVVEVAARYGVSRQAVHAWIARYHEGGLEALGDRSSRPRSCPHQMPIEVELAVVELRLAHPRWGPRTIAERLGRAGVTPVPSISGIYRALRRRGLVDYRPRRRKRSDYRRWERDRAMELWQLDVVGDIVLKDGTELKAVTGVDDHSRYCVLARLVPRATARAVCGAFLFALEAHGAPDEVLTDNGRVFTGKFSAHPHEVLFDRICRENGIRHLLTAVRSPTTTGKIERFHRTLREDFLAEASLVDLDQAQEALDLWVAEYNTDRPHQSLDMATPAERFASATPTVIELHNPEAAVPAPAPAPTAGVERVTRRVMTNGTVSVSYQRFSLGLRYAGALVEVDVHDDRLDAWLDGRLVRSVLRTSQGKIHIKRAQQR